MKARVLTAVAAIPLILAAVFCTSPWPLIVLLGLTVIACGIELASLSRVRVPSSGLLWTIGVYESSRLATSSTALNHGGRIEGTSWFLLIAFCVFLVGVAAVWLLAQANRRAQSPPFSQASALGMTFFGNAWHAAPLAMLAALHAWQNANATLSWDFRNPLLLALIPVWAGDTAAMLAGRAFGKRLLAPSISPKKTVEGAVANLICALSAALLIGPWVGAAWPVSIIAGLSAGVLGQAGDLFQSWLKRSADRKDSGGLLPGHGGVLDRIDALLFAAPPTVLAYFWLS